DRTGRRSGDAADRPCRKARCRNTRCRDGPQHQELATRERQRLRCRHRGSFTAVGHGLSSVLLSLERSRGTMAAYVRGGKTPCKAMQKLSVRYAIMLLCGRLPPAGDSACGAICTIFEMVVLYNAPFTVRVRTAPSCGSLRSAGVANPCSV